jgi:hypothetical protein
VAIGVQNSGDGDGEPAAPTDPGAGGEDLFAEGAGHAANGASGKDLFAQLNRDLLSQVNGMFRAWGKSSSSRW